MQSSISWQESSFFQGTSEVVINKLSEFVSESAYTQGDVIFSEGDLAEELFLLKSGQVELNYQLPTRPEEAVRITKVNPGEVFAWSALTGGDQLTANAVAFFDCSVFTIGAQHLVKVMDENPAFGYHLMQKLSELVAGRLKATRDQFKWLQSI